MAANGITRQEATPERGDPRGFLRRLHDPRPLVLDGATGTELERRGVRSSLPLWSAHALVDAPAVVEAVHRDYVAAGAELLTANTFRTHARSLAAGGLGERAAALTRDAVALARRAARSAAASRPVFVLGSAAPLEDCFRPDRVPDDTALEREHALHAEHLRRAGVDAILVETMNTVREARAALVAALDTGLPALVSFVCDEGARLLSGEPLSHALEAVRPWGPRVVLVNCLPARAVAACLAVLAEGDLPFGVYANLGAPVDEPGSRRSDECSPDEFAAQARGWLEAGARIVGGCCGTGPGHVRALHALVSRWPSA